MFNKIVHAGPRGDEQLIQFVEAFLHGLNLLHGPLGEVGQDAGRVPMLLAVVDVVVIALVVVVWMR